MKKALILLILILFTVASFSMAAPAKAAKKGKKPTIFIKASYNIMLPADSDFKDLYGDQQFFPEVKVGVHFSKKLYIWGGFGLFSKSGELNVLDTVLDTDTKQNFISGGIGYCVPMSGKMNFRIEAGACYFKYEETAMDTTVSDNAFGFRGDLGLSFNFSKSVFAELFAGYMTASDDINEFSVKLGGVYSGVALGFRF